MVNQYNLGNVCVCMMSHAERSQMLRGFAVVS